jgi:hypothetical protein
MCVASQVFAQAVKKNKASTAISLERFCCFECINASGF